MSLDPSLPAAGPIAAAGRIGRTRLVCVGTIAAMHAAAFGVMFWTESGWVAPVLFLLSWACLNFIFLRASAAAGLSPRRFRWLFVGILITLSHFKFTVLWMVINFFDVLIVDSDTIASCFRSFPICGRSC